MLEDAFRGAGLVRVSRDEWEILEVHYWRGKPGSPAGRVQIVFAAVESSQRVTLTFKGVTPGVLPVLATAQTIEIINQHLRQYESPDQVAVWLEDEDGSRELAFSARGVNESGS